jgi:HPt (histidine-containing phosphotransfer) domain-containing protein
VLFYNHKHEFIGIDEDGLKLLNYTTLEDLLEVCGDVADLFAKEPGYIHNFKSFGWIDFLLHADSDARSAIVHANGRTFSCTLAVHNLYLCAEPGSNGYMIDMTHIQSISGDEIAPHVITPKVKPEVKPVLDVTPVPKIESIDDVLPDYGHITPTALSEPGTLDVPSFNDTYFEPLEEPIDDLYEKHAQPLEEEEKVEEEIPVVESRDERPMLGDTSRYSTAEKGFLENLKVDKSYRFDPNVAAHELGLPVDLIQEFIGDFIQQAYEFKDELFEAALKNDSNNIKILSHKLKGVAANLRIEDAFETLSIINTSADPIEIEANLKYFYTIIQKLEGNKVAAEDETPIFQQTNLPDEDLPVQATLPEENDIYEFTLKEDKPLAVEQASVVDLSEEEIFPVSLEEKPDLTFELTPEKDLSNDFPIQSLHYDKVSIAGQLGIEEEFLNELVEEYKRDALTAGKEIAASISAFDTHAWKRTASQLKGISDNLRLSEISDELAILSLTNDAQEANKSSKRLNSFLEQL